MLWHRFRRVKVYEKIAGHLVERLDDLAARALELAVEDAAEIEEASLSFTLATDRLLASGFVTPESRQELLDLWEMRSDLAHRPGERSLSTRDARATLARIDELAETLGSAQPS